MTQAGRRHGATRVVLVLRIRYIKEELVDEGHIGEARRDP
jgi:hypothetical protein